MGLKSLTYIEIDLNYCQEVFSVAPCTATGSGDAKCFNVRSFNCDCQDTPNFNAGTKTLRFGLDNGFLPESISCVPSLLRVSTTDAVVNPGQNIGQRAGVTATFKNHRFGDAGLDQYIVDRTYNPYDQGTYWGKFRARNPYFRYRPMRLIRGYVGQAITEMETEHYVIDTITGPGSQGIVTIKGVDFMRLLEKKTAQAPELSKGYLSANATAGATSITLNPVGIGNSSYPASGKAAIGEEIVSYTRSADVFTCTRGIEGTTAVAHETEDVFQKVLEYSAETSAYIIDDLIVNYTPLDSSYTDLPEWETKVSDYSDVLYTTLIVKPTPVVTLLNELVEQAGLIVFGDNKNNEVFFDVIRNVATTEATVTDRRIIDGTFRQTDQPKLRYSQVWVFYNQKDRFKNLNDPGNYYSGLVDPVADNQYETESIKNIYSRWVPGGGLSIAEDVAARLLARYENPPRKFTFELWAEDNLSLGATIPLTSASLEDCYGAQEEINVSIVGVKTEDDGVKITAEEQNFDSSIITGDKNILIDYDTNNLDLRALYDSLYASVDTVNPITFKIKSGVVVGSTSNTTFAVVTGTWPGGTVPTLDNNGYIVGKGGDASDIPTVDADDGGDALNVTVAFTVDNTGGVIGGGGGGGSGGNNSIPAPPYTQTQPGGGGAGRLIGQGGNGTGSDPDGDDGLLDTGGNGYDQGGDGGDLGAAGAAGTGASPSTAGAAGVAVDGDTLVTWTAVGTIHGTRIN